MSVLRVRLSQPMPLDPVTTLAPYSVTAKIGEGGMGVIYGLEEGLTKRTGGPRC